MNLNKFFRGKFVYLSKTNFNIEEFFFRVPNGGKSETKNSVLAFLKCMEGSVLAFPKCTDGSVLVSLKCMDGSVLAHIRLSIQSLVGEFRFIIAVMHEKHQSVIFEKE